MRNKSKPKSKAGSKQASARVKHGKVETYFMAEAIALSFAGMRSDRGGPFGAVIARQGEIISRGNNQVTSVGDPTAHAEIVAIREACRVLGTHSLAGCDLYTSCEPCPMCLGAAYWAGLDRIFCANTRRDAEAVGFGDAFIYREMDKPGGKRKLPLIRMMRKEALVAFKEWRMKSDKTHYGPKAG